MEIQPRIHSKWLILSDVAVFIFSWFFFYYCRAIMYGYAFRIPSGFIPGLVLYTICWTSLFYITGAYRSIYYRSRINELYQTFLTVGFGTLILLFSFILKNPHENNKSYYLEFFSILIPVFSLSLLHRFLFLNFAKKQIKNGSVFFPTLLIGRTEDIAPFFHEFTSNTENKTHKITGYVPVQEDSINTSSPLHNNILLPSHPADHIQETIDQNKIEEIIIVPSKKDRTLLTNILQQIGHLYVNIKIAPDAADMLSGNIHTLNVMATPLIEAHTGNLPLWQQNTKRLFDFCVAFIFGIFFIPFFIYFAIRVRLSSKGPILFKQERIGLKEKPFVMYKFRSMIENAEVNGPQLSSSSDPRITRWGKIMRKWRLDETPQIWNVLKGEMSLVGPRPERKFFVDQLIKSNPEYRYIFKSKPGITSWGMVKFGYASNLDEMIQRMPYDLMYVENASLLLDIKILIFTIKLIFSGKGK
jgi:exopolysaccharide biosynthesis polyprenyl glycosylphosphotransferase